MRIGTGVYQKDINKLQSDLINSSIIECPGQSFTCNIIINNYRNTTIDSSINYRSNANILCWGEILYNDIFYPSTKNHHVHFSWYYETITKSFAINKDFNDAD